MNWRAALQSSKIGKLRRRIERLESLTAFRREPAPTLIVEFVKSDGAGHLAECSYGEVNGIRFDRRPGEREEDFTHRIISSQERRPSSVYLFSE